MSDFPRVELPDVTDAQRAEVALLVEKANREAFIMRQNRAGMLLALIRSGRVGKPKAAHPKALSRRRAAAKVVRASRKANR